MPNTPVVNFDIRSAGPYTIGMAFTSLRPKRWLTLLAVACCAVPASGDVIELKSGGRLVGEVAPDDAGNRTLVDITLPRGGRVTIPRREVKRIELESPAEKAYAQRAPTTLDTVEAQWTLAMWCRDNKLAKQAKAHLGRVVELDPNHEEARSLLGYQQLGGQWLTRDEVMAARGLVRYEGDFRSRQEIALMQRAERWKEKGADWREQLDRWRRWLDHSDREKAAEANQALRTLKEPAAAGALVGLILNEKNLAVRLMLIDTAARIESPTTMKLLVDLSLKDPHEETRLQCLEYLVDSHPPGIIAPYVKSLKSNNNAVVNRAAEALGQIGADEAVSALVDALITEHKKVVGNTGGGDNYSFDTRSGGFSFGGGGPKLLKGQARNPSALTALVTLTGKNFGYDPPAWKAWLASRAKNAEVDLRRDE